MKGLIPGHKKFLEGLGGGPSTFTQTSDMSCWQVTFWLDLEELDEVAMERMGQG